MTGDEEAYCKLACLSGHQRWVIGHAFLTRLLQEGGRKSPDFINPGSSASGFRGFPSPKFGCGSEISLCGSRLNCAVNLLFKYAAAGGIKPETGPNPEVSLSYSLIPKSRDAHTFFLFYFNDKIFQPRFSSQPVQTFPLRAQSFSYDSPVYLRLMAAQQMHDGRCPHVPMC